GEFAITKQVNLVFADVVWTEAVRRTAEVLRKILHRMDVGTNRVLRVVATLEFIQHQLSEMGHSDLLVTQTLHGQQCWGRPRGSVRRASGLVQTRLSPSTPELSANRKLSEPPTGGAIAQLVINPDFTQNAPAGILRRPLAPTRSSW